MRRALRRITACILAVALLNGAPVIAFAGNSSHHANAAAHASTFVANYADLAIEPGEDDCSHAQQSSNGNSHDSGMCGKCCTACTIVSVIPPTPAATLTTKMLAESFALSFDRLIASPVGIEPDIPKPL